MVTIPNSRLGGISASVDVLPLQVLTPGEVQTLVACRQPALFRPAQVQAALKRMAQL